MTSELLPGSSSSFQAVAFDKRNKRAIKGQLKPHLKAGPPVPGMVKLVEGQQRSKITSWFSFTTSMPFSAHSMATRGLQIEKQQFLRKSSRLNQQKSPVHPLIEESKVDVGGGVEGARHQQVVGALQACHAPLFNVTPVSSIS